ncbi:MAG: hypothetical protein PHO07_13440 [Pirellulales bacterium]|nr:hypothetical protein [Pirellulales bacterium]
MILPSATGSLTSDQKRSKSPAAEIIRGADAAYVQRPAGDKRSAAAIVRAYLRRQLALIP